MSLFLLAHVPIFLYLLFRLVVPLKASKVTKWLAALVLLLVSQHYVVRRVLGYMATPELPGLFISIEGWAFASTLFAFVLLVLLDATALLRRCVAGKKRLPGSTFSANRRLFMIGVAASAPAAYGVGRAVSLPEVVRSEIRLAKLAPAQNGLRLVQLTDLHASPLFDRAWMQGLVARVNALEPDLVLFTGDMADGKAGRRRADLEPLAKLQSKYGVFGCVGNHEYYSGYAAMLDILESVGIRMLLNSHARIQVGGADIVVAGLTDGAAAGFGLPLPDVAAALAGAPENALRILLDHKPGNAAANALAGADFQLSGHTHGGHILGMDLLVARFNAGFVRGWYTVNGMPLYVSPGAGLWNGFPVRIGVPGEISHITLQSA